MVARMSALAHGQCSGVDGLAGDVNGWAGGNGGGLLAAVAALAASTQFLFCGGGASDGGMGGRGWRSAGSMAASTVRWTASAARRAAKVAAHQLQWRR